MKRFRRRPQRPGRRRIVGFVLPLAWLLVGAIGAQAAVPQWGDAQTVARTNVTAFVGQPPAVADLNNDGLQDLLVAQCHPDGIIESNPVVVFTNNGAGEFTDSTDAIFVSAPPRVICTSQSLVADFNGDGRPDILIADMGPHGFDGSNGNHNTLILSSGTAKLKDASKGLASAEGNVTHSVAAGDVDNDGDLDVFVGNICCGTEGPYLLLNKGKGSFSKATNRLPSGVTERRNIVSSEFEDVDGDGFVDLILGADLSADEGLVLLNDGHGGFAGAARNLPSKLLTDVLEIRSFALNADSKKDLVLVLTSGYEDWALQALVGKGKGKFNDVSATRLKNFGDAGPPYVFRVSFPDLDGDGDADMLTRTAGSGADEHDLPWLRNDGAAGFVPQALAFGTAFPANPASYAMIDIDGDGGRDLFGVWGPPGEFAVYRSLGPALPPSSPFRLQASRRLKQKVVISWEYSWGATAYEVWRAENSKGTKQLVGQSTRTWFEDLALPSNTSYSYFIRAVNAAGFGAFSTAVTGSTRP